MIGPAATESQPAARQFRVLLSSTRRGARLARLLVERQLDEWGLPRTDPLSLALTAVTAELAANASTHGRTPGRDFEVRLSLTPARIRVEVSDTQPDRRPPVQAGSAPAPDTATGGRGLLLVEAFASRWGCESRDACVKTVWAEVDLESS
ncbi:ATP-binding protein [Streptomyces sp. NBC_01186]|uniref:ATP-binding protein n=1 Tax=Streptomyces sp. NBC_01186 TaxID=2903765 RepID=UPI002E10AD40|nr:ATP-binding protein [Streptomyces sp. NBC_01186]